MIATATEAREHSMQQIHWCSTLSIPPSAGTRLSPVRPANLDGRSGVLAATAATSRFDGIERAVTDIAAGRSVVLLDDTGSATQGDLVIAAQKATTELVAFMVRHGSGFITVPMPAGDCERLALPPMHTVWDRGRAPAYTVTVDASSGIRTGISASDRAMTIRVLADASTAADDLTRPGHVVPLRTNDGGGLTRPGRPEAAVELARAAGLRPASATCAIVSTADPTTMAAADELRRFAARHRLAIVSLTELIEWRHERANDIPRCAGTAIVEQSEIQTQHGEDNSPRPDRRVTR